MFPGWKNNAGWTPNADNHWDRFVRPTLTKEWAETLNEIEDLPEAEYPYHDLSVMDTCEFTKDLETIRNLPEIKSK